MSAFVKIDSSLVNVDAISYVSPYSLYRNCSGTVYFCDGEELKLKFREPFEEVIAKILAASTAKEKENLPPTPPIREKEVCPSPDTNARAHACAGMVVPTLGEVKAVATALGIPEDTAEDFFTYCEAMGWKHKGNVILNWRAMLKAWHRARKRFAVRDAKLTAHIDAKMDEREAKRERRTGSGRRKADNNVEMSDEVREEVRRDFTF